jgi:hypothetical protein
MSRTCTPTRNEGASRHFVSCESQQCCTQSMCTAAAQDAEGEPARADPETHKLLTSTDGHSLRPNNLALAPVEDHLPAACTAAGTRLSPSNIPRSCATHAHHRADVDARNVPACCATDCGMPSTAGRLPANSTLLGVTTRCPHVNTSPSEDNTTVWRFAAATATMSLPCRQSMRQH